MHLLPQVPQNPQFLFFLETFKYFFLPNIALFWAILWGQKQLMKSHTIDIAILFCNNVFFVPQERTSREQRDWDLSFCRGPQHRGTEVIQLWQQYLWDGDIDFGGWMVVITVLPILVFAWLRLRCKQLVKLRWMLHKKRENSHVFSEWLQKNAKIGTIFGETSLKLWSTLIHKKQTMENY